MLSPEGWRHALQLWDDMHRLKPNEADKREMMEAIGRNSVFLDWEKQPDKREKYFAGMLFIRRQREFHADVNRLHQTTEQKTDARRLKSLEGVIKLLGKHYSSVHFARTVARMRDRRGLTSEQAVSRIQGFEETARDLLLCSDEVARETIPKGKVLPIDDEETRLTIALLESVGIKVGATRVGRVTKFIAETWTYTNPGEKILSGEGVKRRILAVRKSQNK
jgi:hypothetical protein